MPVRLTYGELGLVFRWLRTGDARTIHNLDCRCLIQALAWPHGRS
jgi:hypothetical protein